MLYYKFQNYEEFKELFGLNYHSNGTKSRKNKILLSFIKNKALLHNAVKTGNYELLHISDMQTLKQVVTGKIRDAAVDLPYCVTLIDKVYGSSKYSTDASNGICEDEDCNSIRYINHENNDRIFKMKCGKFFRTLILDTAFGQNLPESVINWLCEEFTLEWKAYAVGKIPQNTLFVNEDFERIYSSEHLQGNFGSCMVNRGLHSFYKDSVKAKAAYLQNSEGMVIARCIIYTEVFDQDDKIYRLAERQYATNGNEVYKKALIDALIEKGEIDGYKAISAGCGEPRNFVDVEGNSLFEKKFSIKCNLDYEDYLSYQDSFKWYNICSRIATNYGDGDYDLATTEGSLEENEYDAYDDFHGYACYETTLCYRNGHEYYVDVDNLGDFVWIECDQCYYHKDDVEECPICGRAFVKSDGSYSEMTEKEYCKDDCADRAEELHRQEFWHYSEYDAEYYEDEDDITTFNEWHQELSAYVRKTISIDTLRTKLIEDDWHRYGNEYFNEVDIETNLPYGYVLTQCA